MNRHWSTLACTLLGHRYIVTIVTIVTRKATCSSAPVAVDCRRCSATWPITTAGERAADVLTGSRQILDKYQGLRALLSRGSPTEAVSAAVSVYGEVIDDLTTLLDNAPPPTTKDPSR